MIAALPLALLALPLLDDPNEVRFYDLSSVPLNSGEDSDALNISVLPSVTIRSHYRPEGHDEVDEDGGSESVADLITSLYGEEFEYEGRWADVFDGNRLVVRGPAGLHARVERLLSFLQEAVNAQTRLQVDVVKVAADVAVPAGSIIPVADAEAWVAAAARPGRHESFTLTLRADRPAVFDMSTEYQVVVDYDVEIAQGAAITDPISGTASVGTRLSVAGAPAANGLALTVGWQRGDVIERGSRDLDMAFLVATSNSPNFLEAGSVIEDLKVMNRSAALNTLLPSGKALVLETGVDVSRGRVHEVVVLRQTGSELPALGRFKLDDSGAELVVANLASIAPPRIAGTGTMIWPQHTPHVLRARLWSDIDLGMRRHSQDWDFFKDLLFNGVESLNWSGVGAWLFIRPDFYAAGDRRKEGQAEHEQVLKMLTAMRSESEVVQIETRLSRAGSKQPIAHSTLPVRMGESCTFALGVEEMEVPELDVEVAQFAATADPIVHRVFDGLALWLKPRLSVDGKLLLDVRGGAHLLTDRGETQTGGSFAEFIESSTYEHLFVNELAHMEAVGEGAWRTQFGDITGEEGAGALQLEITVTR